MPADAPVRSRRRGALRYAGPVLGGLVFLTLASMALPPSWLGMANLSADGLKARLSRDASGVAVVDVRTGFEYRGGHIPGAVSLPLHLVPFRLAELAPYRDRTVVLVCLSGHRSRLAGLVLRLAGFRRLANLDGGMAAWRGRGYRETPGTAP